MEVHEAHACGAGKQFHVLIGGVEKLQNLSIGQQGTQWGPIANRLGIDDADGAIVGSELNDLKPGEVILLPDELRIDGEALATLKLCAPIPELVLSINIDNLWLLLFDAHGDSLGFNSSNSTSRT
jgi:hypothetical protein